MRSSGARGATGNSRSASVDAGYFGVRQAITRRRGLFSPDQSAIHEGGHLLFRFLGSEFLHRRAARCCSWRADRLGRDVAGSGIIRDRVLSGWLSTKLVGRGSIWPTAEALQLPLVTARRRRRRGHPCWEYLFSQLACCGAARSSVWLTRQMGNLVMLAVWGWAGVC